MYLWEDAEKVWGVTRSQILFIKLEPLPILLLTIAFSFFVRYHTALYGVYRLGISRLIDWSVGRIRGGILWMAVGWVESDRIGCQRVKREMVSWGHLACTCIGDGKRP
ncbi:hypothetical protein P280DRAFT_58641 [Massarina eburnea CBS 473.64]|uniref:Uncharacterized protein n=1 Tax=Massarina eburnea CBS 473.64 TaxID=1395130 RepID=A0A6A6RXZ6_9PLEO|nr:hypothetical protein P280DRAFT_58641 [Massarina eburnea CBS 473.64]